MAPTGFAIPESAENQPVHLRKVQAGKEFDRRLNKYTLRPLVISEKNAFLVKLLEQRFNFGVLKFDDLPLVLIYQARQSHEQQLPWLESLIHSVSGCLIVKIDQHPSKMQQNQVAEMSVSDAPQVRLNVAVKIRLSFCTLRGHR